MWKSGQQFSCSVVANPPSSATTSDHRDLSHTLRGLEGEIVLLLHFRLPLCETKTALPMLEGPPLSVVVPELILVTGAFFELDIPFVVGVSELCSRQAHVLV